MGGAPAVTEGVSAFGGVATVKHLEAFWTVVVEGGLLGSESHERKFLALQLFQVRKRTDN